MTVFEENSMEERLIFHVDVNSAFLSWEAARRVKEGLPDLREIPSCIGGDPKSRRGIVVAKSIPAKKYGVTTGEPVALALRKCPDLVCVPGDFALFDRCSRAFKKICASYAPVMESFSIDEVFLDMSGTHLIYPDPVAVAHEIKDKIRDELGFTVNVGIGTNKLLAKMASDFEKPDKVHTLFPEEIQKKMWPLPVGNLLFVGKATVKKLEKMGIQTIGQLAACDKELLKENLKKQGESIWNFANGIDFSLVQPVPERNKGYGNSTTISFDVTDGEAAKTVLLALAESVGSRLRADGVKIQVVSVTIKDNQLHKMSHQMVLDSATDITNEIYLSACRLFEELWDGRPIRLLGIQTSRTKEEEARQFSLFDEETGYEKWEQMDHAVDEIRKKFGKDAVKRAAFLKNPLDE